MSIRKWFFLMKASLMVIMVIVASYSDSYCGEREQRRLLILGCCGMCDRQYWSVVGGNFVKLVVFR